MLSPKKFFELLQKHASEFDWFLTSWSCLRAREKNKGSLQFCPVTAVHFAETGKHLGIWEASRSPFNCPGIIRAADHIRVADDQELLGCRRRLLDTLFPNGVK